MDTRDLLVVIDMQNDFITGALGTKEAQAIVPKVKAKIEEFVQNGQPVLFTRDTHYEDYMDTSKAFQQYLIDKEKQADKLKAKKETMKVVSVGGIILTVCCSAVALAAKGVVSVIEARK